MTRLLLYSHVGWGNARLLRLLRHRAANPKCPPLNLQRTCRLQFAPRKHAPPARVRQLQLFGQPVEVISE